MRALLVIVLLGCATQPEAPPCDAATLAGIVAECSARVSQCTADGPCPAEDECNRRLGEREALCLQR